MASQQMTTSQYDADRTEIVYAALRSMGREVETSQWWQDLAFNLYDDAAYDAIALDAATLTRWLHSYHLS